MNPAAGRIVAATAESWTATARHYLIDLDGTLIRGGRATPGAGELLKRLEDRYLVLSNNSSDTAVGLSRKLRHYGLRITPERLLLAGEYTVRWVAARHPGARVLLLGSPTIRRLAMHLGLELCEADPELVLLARDPQFCYRHLGMAANALRNGAAFIVTNPDTRHPGRDGIVPETGALMQGILACLDRPVQPLIIGKPEAALFREALRRLRATGSGTLVIGDNPRTDAAGAVRHGMGYLLVGESPEADAPNLPALLAYRGLPRHSAVRSA